MGEIHTKAVQHQLLEHLQHTYEPYFQSRQIPGHPTYLKIHHQSSMPPLITEWTYKYPIIDCYQLLLKLNEQDWKRENMIYEYRKATYPYFVQIIYFQLQKQQCECANQRYKLSVYTQHIAYRLANFKLTKSIKTNNNKSQQLQYYESFSLDEGIYVLINTLHAYQLLGEQYCVNYPTVFTIGISEKAQIKVWINENWALNNQNYRRIAQGLIIEQIINLIEERMEGNFQQILNSKYNYMNFTFDSIQQMLSPYTINFHKGKQTLQKRINTKVYRQNAETKRFSEKLSMDLRPSADFYQQKSNQPQKISSNEGKGSDRRYFSQQYPKHNNIQPTSITYSCKKNVQGSNGLVMSSPPKHPIKFTFQYSQLTSKLSKSKIAALKKQAYPVLPEQPVIFHNPLIKTMNLPNSNFNFIANNNKSKPIMQSHEYTIIPHGQTMIDQKLQLGPRAKYQEKIYINTQSKGEIVQKIIEVSPNHITPHRSGDKLPSNHSQINSSNRAEQSKNGLSLPISQQKAAKQKVNIRDITQQFIILLQSDKKIKQSDMTSEFESISPPHSVNTPTQTNQISQQKFKTSSFVRQIQQIKEQDEEVNYSLEQNS